MKSQELEEFRQGVDAIAEEDDTAGMEHPIMSQDDSPRMQMQ